MGEVGQQNRTTTAKWNNDETQTEKLQRRRRAGWLRVNVFHSCRSCSKEKFIAQLLDAKYILALSSGVET
jgi:hypothetical protein